MPVLDIKHISKSYKQVQALEDVNLQLEEGYVLGLVGKNGAGKTTLIKSLLGLLSIDSGAISVFGLDHGTNLQEIKSRIGFVHEESYLYESLNVKDTERICRSAYQKWDSDRFLSLIKQFELPVRKKVKQFSKGMKMRLSLAIALSHEAELIVMDEPSSGLDPLVRKDLFTVLRKEMIKEHRTIIISTHITSDLEQIADHIAILDEGKVHQVISTEQLRENYAICKCSPEEITEEMRSMFIGYEEHPYGFEGLTDVPDRLKQYTEAKILFERPTIEQLFIYTHRGIGYENTID